MTNAFTLILHNNNCDGKLSIKLFPGIQVTDLRSVKIIRLKAYHSSGQSVTNSFYPFIK
jgi:hypothetical protein